MLAEHKKRFKEGIRMYGINKKLKSVGLITHAHDVTISAEFVSSIAIKDIEVEINYFSDSASFRDGEVEREAYACDVSIDIRKEGNHEITVYYPNAHEPEKTTAFEYLTDRTMNKNWCDTDIEKIELHYEDGTQDMFLVPYDDGKDSGNEFPNVNLETLVAPDGSLAIWVKLKRSRADCEKATHGEDDPED